MSESSPHGAVALADAAGLGLPALAEVMARTEDGVVVVDGDRRYGYANPAACQILGESLEQLRGRDLLSSFQAGEHATVVANLPTQLGETAAPFTCLMRAGDGAEREIVCVTFGIQVVGALHAVVVLRDLGAPRAAARAAAALVQVAAQLGGTGTTTNEILSEIARHAVEGTRALSSGIMVMGDDHRLAAGGGYGPDGPNFGDASRTWNTLRDVAGEDVIAAMTDGTVCVGDVPGEPVVLPDARAAWEANPITQGYAERIAGYDWRAACVCPLSWENRVFGFLRANLPSEVAGPSESELSFYAALADQAAVAVTIARLTAQAGEAAALLERARLAREMHDSVSQALFSMTMHARAAQLSMAQSGLDQSGPLGRSIRELADLTRGALAEMRALIFELRPAALAEEGLVAALRKQAAALTARERVMVAVDGPDQRLDLGIGVEEHLYRIASEALHNVVNHARADHATVSVSDYASGLQLTVCDDGAGFDQRSDHPGHLGLSTMAERAATISAELVVRSAPGSGTTVTVSLDRDHGNMKLPRPEDCRDQHEAASDDD